MTLREWRWFMFRYVFGFVCVGALAYFVICALVEAPPNPHPFEWWHPRIAIIVTSFVLLAMNVGPTAICYQMPKRPKADVDESIVEEVRQHLRGSK